MVDVRRSLAQRMRNPRFRIEDSGLYWIVAKRKDEQGKNVNPFEPFRPFPHQQLLNKKIFDEGARRILVPKARRMGFSTDINMCQFDSCLNNQDFHSRIVDMSEDDAKDKLVNRVTRAWDRLNENVETGLVLNSRSGKELAWSNGSRFTASISGRGGDAAQFLHVSELGPIDYKDPKRSSEIINGAFPAADGGIIVVESTAKGPQGNFKRLCDNAQEIPTEERTPDDWDVLFFGWWMDPRHVMHGSWKRITKEVHEYCDWVQKELDITISLPQRLWYQVTSDTVDEMKYEYPSLLQECWEAPVEGAIYADDINKARNAGRVSKYPYIKRVPVFTIWDLGGPRNTRCIMFQISGGEIRIIDAIAGGYDEVANINGPRDPSDWVEALYSRPWSYAKHILPHDGAITQYAGKTFQAELQAAGLTNVVPMERRQKNDHWQRINPTWTNFERFVFNTESPGVEVLLNHLSCYHTEKESDGISVKEVPKHDWSSHYAEAFSSIIEAEDRGYVSRHASFGLGQMAKRKPRIKKYNPYG